MSPLNLAVISSLLMTPLLAAAGEAEKVLPDREPHEGVDENLFKGTSWYTPPPAPPPSKRVITPMAERKPVAPPLPYRLLGSYETAGEKTTYYLVKGDRIYDVVIGDEIDNTYSVDGVSNGQLMFTYLPLKTSQGLRLGEE